MRLTSVLLPFTKHLVSWAEVQWYGALRDRKKAGIESMTSGAGAMVATAMRVVNAVPYVVAAEPGLVSSVELPLTIPKQAFNPA